MVASKLSLIFLLVWASCLLTVNYAKYWGPREGVDPARWDIEMAAPYEQSRLEQLQALVEANGGRVGQNDEIPEKRQIRYHQCYFNPISCFKKRK